MDYEGPSGVIERWQPELDRIAPPTERGHSSLVLRWEPGEEWSPVNRWVVWEVMRPEMAPRLGVQQDLDGPNPRDYGFWDPIMKKFRRTRRFSITQAQWLFYRRTGMYGRCVWVVQGRNGGTKRFWSEVEQNLAMMTYGEEFNALGIGADALQPPAPGELPYCEPNDKTIEALHGLDMVHRFGSILHLLSSQVEMGAALDIREQTVAEEMARQVWYWMDDQIEETLDLVTRAQVQDFWDNTNPDLPVPDYDAGEADFITQVAQRVL